MLLALSPQDQANYDLGVQVVTFGLITLAVVYLFPTLVAIWRRSPNKLGVFFLNLFLGWTLAGWVAALVWASYKPEVKYIVIHDDDARPSPRRSWF